MTEMTAHQQATAALLKTLSELEHLATFDLARKDALGELNLSGGQLAFDNIIALFKAVKDSDPSALPIATINEIQAQANAAKTLFDRVRNFSLSHENPLQTRNSLLAETESLWFQSFRTITPIVGFASRAKSDSLHLTNELQALLTQQKSASEASIKEAASVLNEMTETLGKVKESAAQAGVTKHSVDFKNEADGHKKFADRWLWITTGFGAAMSGFAALIYFADHSPKPDATALSIAHLLAPKITILLVLGFALVWSSRNYSAAKHNEVVNLTCPSSSDHA